jgi:hypothetical protein
MEPNCGASEITLRDGCDWSPALRQDLALGGELALRSHPPPKASINCILLVICCSRSIDIVSQFTSKLTRSNIGKWGVRRVLPEFGSGGLFAGKSHAQN